MGCISPDPPIALRVNIVLRDSQGLAHYIRDMRIQRLSPEVVDQIAAGEVLERPANLCKELVENSLDAGATEIEIFVEQGGRSLRVLDNGSGIHAEDLPLLFERHATSKIEKSSDLWRLGTFGFRGEAMASVSAVSRTRVQTRTAQDRAAHEIFSEWGRVSEVRPSGRTRGTTVEVDGLFENVPARLKFLKSDGAEVAQIKRVAKALALAHPKVEFRLHVNGQLIFPARESEHLRAEDVLGVPLFEAIGELEGSRVRVHFAGPDSPGKTTQNIWIFVNRRWVQDRGLQAAVTESYRHLLMHGEFPQCALFLEVPTEQVDVNVHPAKTQVKFADASAMFRLVHRTLRGALEKAPWLPQILASEEILDVRPNPIEQESLEFNTAAVFKKKEWSIRETLETFGPPRIQSDLTGKLTPEVSPTWSGLQVIGQANLTYVVAQSSRALIFIDQHAAHERVAFERLMDGFRNQRMESQRFLLPISVEMEAHHAELMIQYADSLRSVGLELERGGPNMLLVTAAPSLLKDSTVSMLLPQMASQIEEQGGEFTIEKKVGEIFATMACHSVVRAGQALSQAEMESLLSQMDEYPLSSFCPHGRPVFVEIPFRKLDEDFGRIV